MFLTLEQIKDFLTVTDAKLDSKLEIIRAWAEGYIIDFLGYSPEEKERVEFHNGNGYDRIFLDEFPVTAVKSVEALGSDNATWNAVTPTRLAVWPTGEVRLIGATYPKGVQNIRVTYTSGYSPMDPCIVMAGLELCALKFKDSPSGDNRLGVTSKVKGSAGTQFQENLDKQAYAKVLQQIEGLRKLHV